MKGKLQFFDATECLRNIPRVVHSKYQEPTRKLKKFLDEQSARIDKWWNSLSKEEQEAINNYKPEPHYP